MNSLQEEPYGIIDFVGPRPDALRDKGLQELGVNEDLRNVIFADNGMRRPFEEAKALFDKYKVDLKKRFKKLALELHPDRNAGLAEDERLKKEERFKALSRAVDFVFNMQLAPYRPQPQMRIIIMQTGFGFGGSSTTTSTGSWGTYG